MQKEMLSGNILPDHFKEKIVMDVSALMADAEKRKKSWSILLMEGTKR